MHINTTLNMHPEIRMRINEASRLSGFSRNETIIRLLKRTMKDVDRFYPKEHRLVQYQERDEDARWKPFHVTWESYEYDYFQDCRKVYRLSISNLLAIAVRKYLKRVIYDMIRTKNSKTIDNNRLFAYTIGGEMVGGVICWRFYWGMPDNLELLFPFDST